MNLGILKLFKYFIIVILLVGCATLSDQFSFLFTSKPMVIEDTLKQKELNLTKSIENIEEVQKENNTTSKQILHSVEPKAKKSDFRISTTLDQENLKEFTFDLIKKGKDDNNTLLIVGGIQGDEPGGFMAASLISTHYEITKGSLWVVPNLNFYAILKRSRGPFGDMNRKFANLSKDDPEYEIIQRIKNYIIDPKVKLILNLHDGSGFYRPTYIDNMHQPRRWGQTIVIDQEILKNVKEYNQLHTIAKKVVEDSNNHLLNKEERYSIKNTNTRFESTFEEKEMAKTLTYFAIQNGKSAFGHETSKNIDVTSRIYYKLLAIEKFMDIMGIKYKRKFDLTRDTIDLILEDDIHIILDDTDVKIPLKDIRNIQKYFPIDEKGIIKYLPSNPLIKIIKNGDLYAIYYGNRRLTQLEADYTKHLSFDTKVLITIDGEEKEIQFGDTIEVKDYFNVKKNKDFRINVIGYKSKDGIETDKNITKNMFIKRYSIQEHGDLFRIEFYQDKTFVGMILVNYK